MKRETYGFLELKNRYSLKGTLVACAALHVGSGFADISTGSDAGFISDAGGAFVPGSSLRGVLRSTLERMLQGVDNGKGCVLFEEGSHRHCPTVNKKRAEALAAEKNEQRLMAELFGEEGLCDVCRLFGSPLLASRLRVSDARPSNATQVNKRDGVGIDRDTETAREGIKFDFMAMEQYSTGKDKVAVEFLFELLVENAHQTDLALLGILIHELRTVGIDVGGKKARGLGRMKLKDGYTVDCFDDKESLKRYLQGKGPKQLKQPDFEKLLNGALKAYFEEASHAQTVGE